MRHDSKHRHCRESQRETFFCTCNGRIRVRSRHDTNALMSREMIRQFRSTIDDFRANVSSWTCTMKNQVKRDDLPFASSSLWHRQSHPLLLHCICEYILSECIEFRTCYDNDRLVLSRENRIAEYVLIGLDIEQLLCRSLECSSSSRDVCLQCPWRHRIELACDRLRLFSADDSISMF
jgi:hypothetical protein